MLREERGGLVGPDFSIRRCLGHAHLEGGPEADTQNSGGITSPVFCWKVSVLQEELEQVAPTCWNRCNLSIFSMFSPCMYDICTVAFSKHLTNCKIEALRVASHHRAGSLTPQMSSWKTEGKRVGQSRVGTTKC